MKVECWAKYSFQLCDKNAEHYIIGFSFFFISKSAKKKEIDL